MKRGEPSSFPPCKQRPPGSIRAIIYRDHSRMALFSFSPFHTDFLITTTLSREKGSRAPDHTFVANHYRLMIHTGGQSQPCYHYFQHSATTSKRRCYKQEQAERQTVRILGGPSLAVTRIPDVPGACDEMRRPQPPVSGGHI